MTLKSLEMNCRGIYDIAERWKVNHANVRELWKKEDLICQILECFKLIEFMIENKDQAVEDFKFGYFLNVCRFWQLAAELVRDLASPFENDGFVVENLQELRDSIGYTSYFIEKHCNKDLQKALDRISSVCDERLMTESESASIKTALAMQPSTIKVQQLPSKH